ncbi:MAG: dienelactone hydrolase, partial [Verrucomicrobiota bacterium]|nr:dienelactone hydrolase [Verrucomicrobiota bacterium]
MSSHLLLSVPVFLFALVFQGKAYDPLETFEGIETLDRTIKDKSRDRSIPLRFYFPVGTTNSPVILFSHGLGGSRNGSSYLGKHWAGRGYVAVFMQHVGSDESVWKDVGPLRRMFALKKAASSKNFMLRVQDVSAVLDQLENLNQKSDLPLSGKLDLSRVGMTGHSFGALTTQAVSGEKIPLS